MREEKKLREDGGSVVTAGGGWFRLEMENQRSTESGGNEKDRERDVRLRVGLLR